MSKTPKAKALETLQKFARIAAANDQGLCQCVSCGEWGHYKEMDSLAALLGSVNIGNSLFFYAH